MKIVTRASALLLLLAVVAVLAWQAGTRWARSGDEAMEAASESEPCQMEQVLPSRGTLQLEYLNPSSAADPDRNDYRLSGTLVWDDQAALDCYDDGYVDWAYEHGIEYGEHVDRVVWDQDFRSFGDAQPYLDTVVDSNPNHTELSIGIAKPERLLAGIEYSFSYKLMLSNHPENGKQWIALWSQVVEKQCTSGGPWCSGLNTGLDGTKYDEYSKNYSSDAWVGWTRGFAAEGTTCWAWTSDGNAPTDCSPSPPPPPSPPVTTPTPNPVTSASATPEDPATETPGSEGASPSSGESTATPTDTPSSSPETPPPPPPTAQGTVNGCNSYGQNCENNPIYVSVPAEGYDWREEPKVTTVKNETVLTARCYAIGAVTYNWAHSQGDPGVTPYDSDVYFSVQDPTSGTWGFIPDTYFVRDKDGRLGLPQCQ